MKNNWSKARTISGKINPNMFVKKTSSGKIWAGMYKQTNGTYRVYRNEGFNVTYGEFKNKSSAKKQLIEFLK